MRERGELPCLATCLLAQACQHLWLASSHDVYQRFTWIDLAIPPWLPTALMLAVIISPHGSMTIQLDEATLSQELRTTRLLWPHVLVGYRWQHTGLHPRPFSPVITDTCVTSCRNPHRTGRAGRIGRRRGTAQAVLFRRPSSELGMPRFLAPSSPVSCFATVRHEQRPYWMSSWCLRQTTRVLR
jgi:hypothetical protein